MGNRIFTFFDTETTGLSKVNTGVLTTPTAITGRGSEVIQIGGLFTDEKMNPLRLFCYYCDAVAAASHHNAYIAHNIDLREVRSQIPSVFLPEVMTTYLPEFFVDDNIFVGYNVDFDITMVQQSLANSPLKFSVSRLQGNIIPRHGRHSVDVAEYVKLSNTYRKLTSFREELTPLREEFMSTYGGALQVDTNCHDMLARTWNRAHNSFFDSLETFLLWRSRIWKKKVV